MAVDFALESARVGRLGFALPDRPPSRASSLPQWNRVHLQKTGRLSGRLREQARSHSGTEYICKKQLGCQAAFASRLAPTVEPSTSAKNRSAVRPPSRASSLPQWNRVHLQKTGRLSGRLPEQARSHSGTEYICTKQVGCQAAFASRLAPTVEPSTSAKNSSAVRPPSRASSLPQWNRVHLQKTGRLSGRLREQARSHSGTEYICKKQVGCQAAFASKLAPTVEPSTSAKNRSAVRPPSRAGSLPQKSKSKAPPTSHRLGSSPLNRMSVSSAAALDLAVLAPSAG